MEGLEMKVEAGLLSRLAAESFGTGPSLACAGRIPSSTESDAAACRVGSELRW